MLWIPSKNDIVSGPPKLVRLRGLFPFIFSVFFVAFWLFALIMSYFVSFIVLAAAVIVLCFVAVRFSYLKVPVLLIVFAVLGGFLTGFLQQPVFENWLGFSTDDVSKIRAVCVSDSRLQYDGKYRTKIDISFVSDRHGATASSHASALLVSDIPFFWGNVVDADVYYVRPYDRAGAEYLVRANRVFVIGFDSNLLRLRSYVVTAIRRKIESWSYNAGSFFTALFLGDRSYIPDDVYEAFKRAGALHVLALSGLHVGIVSLLCLAFFSLFLSDFAARAVSCLVLGFYVFIAGFYPSLIRAALFFAFVFLFSCRGLRLINLIGFVAVFMVVFFPVELFSVGALLSFSAVLGIALFLWPVSVFIRPAFGRFLSDVFACSFSAFWGTLPVTVFVFSFFSLAGAVSAVLLVPVVTAFMLLAVVRLLFSFLFSFLDGVFDFVLGWLYWAIERLLDAFSVFPVVSGNVALLFVVVWPVLTFVFLLWYYPSLWILRQ